jgi:hypothetical protein
VTISSHSIRGSKATFTRLNMPTTKPLCKQSCVRTRNVITHGLTFSCPYSAAFVRCTSRRFLHT